MPVQAKALEIIDQVIARRDSAEEIVHLRSAPFTWIEECVGHGQRSLCYGPPPCDPNLLIGVQKLERLLLQITLRRAVL